jgi:hypothetical protein
MPVGDSVGDAEAARGPMRRTSELPALEGEDPPAEHLKEGSVRPLQNSGNREHMGLYSGFRQLKYDRYKKMAMRLIKPILFFTVVHS